MVKQITEREVEEAIKWLSRDVRNWFKSDFDATPGYQCDVGRFCTRAVPDVCDEGDLTPLGAAIYRSLKAEA